MARTSDDPPLEDPIKPGFYLSSSGLLFVHSWSWVWVWERRLYRCQLPTEGRWYEQNEFALHNILRQPVPAPRAQGAQLALALGGERSLGSDRCSRCSAVLFDFGLTENSQLLCHQCIVLDCCELYGERQPAPSGAAGGARHECRSLPTQRSLDGEPARPCSLDSRQ